MRNLIILTFLSAIAAAAAGCHSTVKGVEKDTHEDVKWVGHHV
jgi:hypothetical protein